LGVELDSALSAFLFFGDSFGLSDVLGNGDGFFNLDDLLSPLEG
jgi:hypothetical protein